MFKNVATKIALFAFDTTTGAPKTGDAANITAYVSKDYGTVTALADTSATEMDATNAKGWYLFDVAQAESNGDALLFTAKSSTSNVSIVGQYISTTPNRFTSQVIDAAGLVDANAVKLGPSGSGTAQTARDVGASVLVAGDFTSTMKTSMGTAVAASAVASVTGNVGGSVVGTTGDATNISAIKAKTDNLPTAPADETLIIAATNGILSRLGAPAGASVSADVAAVKSDTGAIKTKTDNLPASPAATSDIPSAATVAAAVMAAIVEGTTTVVQMFRGFAAALFGKASGMATTTAVIRDTGDSKDRITATVDASGNRTAVTLDLS